MKKHTTKLLAVLLALTFAVVLSACKSNPETAETTTAKTTAAASDDSSAPTSTNTDLFTDRDLDPSYDSATTIDLNKESSRVTITEAGTYVLTGTLHGQVVVKVADTDKVQLVLNNATITNNTSAAIYVQSGDKVFITTAEGSRNTVSSSATFTSADEETGDNVDGAIFSKATLTFNGSGKLTVNCDNGHGVVSKDDLKVTGGTLDVTAAKKGLAGKDSIRIHDGTITVKAGGDGLHTSNDTDSDKGFVYIEGGSLSIASGDDGIHAETDLTIKGGKISVTQSEEGLEGQNIDLSGGTIDIVSTDDGLNASEGSSGTDNTDDFGGYGHGGGFGANQNASLIISGGTIHVNAQGDALDSNGSMVVSGGTVYVSGPTGGGNGAIDCDNAQITGGTVIAAGSAGMAMNFGSSSTQCAMLVSFDGTVSGGTKVTLKDSDGRTILSYTPEKDYQTVVLSSADIRKGETYTVTAGSQTQTVEMTDTVVGTGDQMGGGPMGGRGGPRGNIPDAQSSATPQVSS